MSTTVETDRPTDRAYIVKRGDVFDVRCGCMTHPSGSWYAQPMVAAIGIMTRHNERHHS